MSRTGFFASESESESFDYEQIPIPNPDPIFLHFIEKIKTGNKWDKECPESLILCSYLNIELLNRAFLSFIFVAFSV